MSAITQQELGDKQRLEEIDQGQKFQTSERLGSQGFMSGENKLGREFTTSERLGSQTFSSGEADKQRGFITGERVAGQQFQTSERGAAQQFAREERGGSQAFSQSEQLRMEELQKRGIVIAEKELVLNDEISRANLEMAKDTSKIQKQQASAGILGGIFGTGVSNASNFGIPRKLSGKLGYFGF
jgi:hypothetical protein